MIEIVDLDEFEPTDALILSWRKMMMGRDQLDWEYDESWVAKEPAADADAIAEFRKWRDKQRGRNHPLWPSMVRHASARWASIDSTILLARTVERSGSA